jgi:hypothetical protein
MIIHGHALTHARNRNRKTCSMPFQRFSFPLSVFPLVPCPLVPWSFGPVVLSLAPLDLRPSLLQGWHFRFVFPQHRGDSPGNPQARDNHCRLAQ